jgi:hypothetical protein
MRPTTETCGVAAGEDTLLISSLGVGTYMGTPDAATDEAQLCALVYSVTRGWNLIDTGGRTSLSRAGPTPRTVRHHSDFVAWAARVDRA